MSSTQKQIESDENYAIARLLHGMAKESPTLTAANRLIACWLPAQAITRLHENSALSVRKIVSTYFSTSRQEIGMVFISDSDLDTTRIKCSIRYLGGSFTDSTVRLKLENPILGEDGKEIPGTESRFTLESYFGSVKEHLDRLIMDA